MEQNGDSGRGLGPQRSGSTPDGSQSTEEHWSTPANPKGATTERDGASWINWQSALYIFVLGAISLLLVPLTSLWWIVPLLGAAVPITLAVLDRPIFTSGKHDDKKTKEQELLAVLAERGELTPTTAAMRTGFAPPPRTVCL